MLEVLVGKVLNLLGSVYISSLALRLLQLLYGVLHLQEHFHLLAFLDRQRFTGLAEYPQGRPLPSEPSVNSLEHLSLQSFAGIYNSVNLFLEFLAHLLRILLGCSNVGGSQALNRVLKLYQFLFLGLLSQYLVKPSNNCLLFPKFGCKMSVICTKLIHMLSKLVLERV